MHDKPESLTLGFIGLGAMGWPMCGHLQRAGHRLRVWARDPARRERAAAAGMQACASAAEVAAGADVVLTNVTSTADVEQVLLGEHGVVHGAAPGLLCIDHSTIAPDGARRIGAGLRERGVDFVDAPVSGGERGAIDGTLTVMLGGDAAACARALPLLRCYGRHIERIGDIGAGQVAKLCNQIVQVITIEGIAEAMRYCAAEGADAQRVLQALSSGFAGSRMLELMGPKMVARDFAAGIQARLHAKDFGLAADAAAAAGLTLPALAAVRKQLDRLVELGLGTQDTSALLQVLELG
jgi:3-hydroxyisobutyrate dehydrogenase-like beta-hydroxyacid dehydrogenase